MGSEKSLIFLSSLPGLMIKDPKWLGNLMEEFRKALANYDLYIWLVLNNSLFAG
jgi:hypothetical protein